MLGSIGVIGAAVLISLTALTWIDAVVAIAIGLWVLPRTWGLLKETVNVLLEGVPEGIDVEDVRSALKSLPGVDDVHDLHIWAISSDNPSLSGHIVLTPRADPEQLRKAALAALQQHFRIAHVTVQTELSDCRQQGGQPHW